MELRWAAAWPGIERQLLAGEGQPTIFVMLKHDLRSATSTIAKKRQGEKSDELWISSVSFLPS